MTSVQDCIHEIREILDSDTEVEGVELSARLVACAGMLDLDIDELSEVVVAFNGNTRQHDVIRATVMVIEYNNP